jgi:Protein of unknown function (DUF2480)
MEKDIVNKIALSPLVSFDLADYHDPAPRVGIDIAERLFMGMILKEGDFRAWLETVDWSQYTGQHVHLHCSADAIIPGWTWMLLAIQLQPFASTIVFGSREDLEKAVWQKSLERIDYHQLEGKKIVVKGCGEIQIPQATFVEFIVRLRAIADKLMYGEPCSTVPLWKKEKSKASAFL